MRHYKYFIIMQRFAAEAWRELSERFLEVFRYPVDRVLNITPTPDGVVIVQNEWDGRLKTWMIPSVATLRWLIYEATAGETPPRIYHLPPNTTQLDSPREGAGREVPHNGEAILGQGGWVLSRCLPRELRIKLYDDVALRRGGLTYKGIIEEIYRRYGVRLSKSHISYWLRGVHSPYNGRRIPSLELLEPSEELAYMIGVVLGDGYAYRKRRAIKGYRDVVVGLKAMDREFVEEFAKCLAKVLGRKQIRPRFRDDVGKYVVEVGSKTLYELLKKPVDLDRLKKYIEHCKRCVAAFLRGFADSEGSVNKRGYICIYNTDQRLLIYVKELLRRLGIESTGPTLNQRGTIINDPRMGKKYTHNKDCHRLHIRASSNMSFYRYVGFTIRRKQMRLES
jgi:intein-encoded DNA endonuclease-like protein